MISNKTKRNIWLTLAVLAAVTSIARVIDAFMGNVKWWDLISVFVILAFCIKYYLCYQRKVKAGELFN